MAIHKCIRIHQYLDDWLVRATSHQTGLQHTQDLVKTCQTIRLAGEFRKIRTGTKAGLRPCRLPVRPRGRSGPTYTGPLAEPSGQNTVTTGLSSLAVHVSDSHRKASSPRPTSYEIHTVASQKQLEGTRVTEKGDPNTKVLAPTFTMVAARGQYPYRPTITPNKTCSANLENLDLVHQKSSNSQSPTHSRPAKCGSRQAIQARPDHPNRVGSPSGGLPSNMQQVALA